MLFDYVASRAIRTNQANPDRYDMYTDKRTARLMVDTVYPAAVITGTGLGMRRNGSVRVRYIFILLLLMNFVMMIRDESLFIIVLVVVENFLCMLILTC
jgi:hypothetical protein